MKHISLTILRIGFDPVLIKSTKDRLRVGLGVSALTLTTGCTPPRSVQDGGDDWGRPSPFPSPPLPLL
ncbi:hypothetical protein JTB14_033950 [Gonioctena quinquepunctata]|nr:hypothetical protein JTB14_033950 [Gonioctena quinquepunctata]